LRTLAAVKPALVRLLEWQLDQALDLHQQGTDRRGEEDRRIS
jgi:hypothetical protein